MAAEKKSLRIMVDMSITLFHHGHTRLIKKAHEELQKRGGGELVIGLCTDQGVLEAKGYLPEMPYPDRKEILEGLRYVDEVVPVDWLVTEEILEKYKIDFLVHGDDNSNPVPEKKLILFPRTEEISSTELRENAIKAFVNSRNEEKFMFTPGTTQLSPSNLSDLYPVFGRSDDHYNEMEKSVLEKTLALTGHDEIVRLQGSATTAIDVATTNFCRGKVLIINAGYYSERISLIYAKKAALLPETTVKMIRYEEIEQELQSSETYDWILTAYTETAQALLCDIRLLRKLADEKKAKLFLDATGSVNLEDRHELSDVCAFSSCKGLGGLAGAGFITWKAGVENHPQEKPFSLDLETYRQKKTTGPYHAICSLLTISEDYNAFRRKVEAGKKFFSEKFADRLLRKEEEQPRLCSLFKGQIHYPRPHVPYVPRTSAPGTGVICHLGTGYFDQVRTEYHYNLITIS